MFGYFIAVIVNWKWFCPQGTFAKVQRHLWLSQLLEGGAGRVLLASSEYRPGKLLNVLQCTGQYPLPHTRTQQRIILFQTSTVPRLRKPALGQVQSCCLRASLRSKITPETEVFCSFVHQPTESFQPPRFPLYSHWLSGIGWGGFVFPSSLSVKKSIHTDVLISLYMEARCWYAALVIESRRSSSVSPAKSSSLLWFK